MYTRPWWRQYKYTQTPPKPGNKNKTKEGGIKNEIPWKHMAYMAVCKAVVVCTVHIWLLTCTVRWHTHYTLLLVSFVIMSLSIKLTARGAGGQRVVSSRPVRGREAARPRGREAECEKDLIFMCAFTMCMRINFASSTNQRPAIPVASWFIHCLFTVETPLVKPYFGSFKKTGKIGWITPMPWFVCYSLVLTINTRAYAICLGLFDGLFHWP